MLLRSLTSLKNEESVEFRMSTKSLAVTLRLIEPLKSLKAVKLPLEAEIVVWEPKALVVVVTPTVFPEALNSGKTVTSEELLLKTLPLTMAV